MLPTPIGRAALRAFVAGTEGGREEGQEGGTGDGDRPGAEAKDGGS